MDKLSPPPAQQQEVQARRLTAPRQQEQEVQARKSPAPRQQEEQEGHARKFAAPRQQQQQNVQARASPAPRQQQQEQLPRGNTVDEEFRPNQRRARHYDHDPGCQQQQQQLSRQRSRSASRSPNRPRHSNRSRSGSRDISVDGGRQSRERRCVLDVWVVVEPCPVSLAWLSKGRSGVTLTQSSSGARRSVHRQGLHTSRCPSCRFKIANDVAGIGNASYAQSALPLVFIIHEEPEMLAIPCASRYLTTVGFLAPGLLSYSPTAHVCSCAQVPR